MKEITENRPNLARIGQGVFLLSDISKIIGLPTGKIRYWLVEFWNNRFGENFGGYSFGDDKNRAVNFNTFIEFIAFAKFRECGISAQYVQKIHGTLSKEFNTPYPFTKTRFFTDEKYNVWYENHFEIIKLDGKNQLSSKKILAPFLNKIEFDENSIAMRYFPLGKEFSIVIDPKRQFGQPTITETNIKAETIYNQIVYGGETKESMCELYNLTHKQINDTMLFYNKMVA